MSDWNTLERERKVKWGGSLEKFCCINEQRNREMG